MAYRKHWAAGAALAAVTLAGTLLTGCSDGDGEDSPARSVSEAASAVESAASSATDAWASATAEAGRRLDDIRDGVNVKDDVRLGSTATDGDGRTTVVLTVENTAGSEKSFAVLVEFEGSDGGFQDAVLVQVPDVPSGETAEATARSSHDLSGEVSAEVARAVRY
ncbi:hypothetical protein [Streptomyces broussonetiae]|uniref:Secreted protein n=1 Tax=Streptomyces broussonetiae TaxID=2686304 RepID=A0ABV5EKS2_9ACTN